MQVGDSCVYVLCMSGRVSYPNVKYVKPLFHQIIYSWNVQNTYLGWEVTTFFLARTVSTQQ